MTDENKYQNNIILDSEILGLMITQILKWTDKIEYVRIKGKIVELVVDPVYIYTERNKFLDREGFKLSKIKIKIKITIRSQPLI